MRAPPRPEGEIAEELARLLAPTPDEERIGRVAAAIED